MATNPSNNSIYYILLSAVLIIGAGAGGYLAGVHHAQAAPATSTVAAAFPGGDGGGAGGGAPGGGAGGGGRRFAGGGGGFVTGTVSAVNGNTVTVSNARTGEDTVIDLSGSPSISKTVTGSASDITTGETVVVTGTAGSDGSIAATSIQVRPAGSTAVGGPPGAL